MQPNDKNFFVLLDEQKPERYEELKQLFSRRLSDSTFRNLPIKEEHIRLLVYYYAWLVHNETQETARKMAYDAEFMKEREKTVFTKWLTFSCKSYKDWLQRALASAYFSYNSKK